MKYCFSACSQIYSYNNKVPAGKLFPRQHPEGPQVVVPAGPVSHYFNRTAAAVQVEGGAICRMLAHLPPPSVGFPLVDE